MKTFASLLCLVSMPLAIAAVPACAGEVALEDRPCPCADGWTCCASRNVCVAPGTSCGSEAPTSDAGGDAGSDAPPTDDGPIELATAQSARCMTTDHDHVYWENADGLVVGNAKRGGALQSAHFLTPTANDPLCGLAVDGDTLFATSYALGKIAVLDLRSNGDWSIGASGSLVGALTTPSSLAIDADAIYVTEYDAGRVTRVPRTRAPATVLAEGLVHPHGIVVSGDTVYFVERGDEGKAGAIKRVPALGGTAPVVVAGDQSSPDGLAMWNGILYWTANHVVWSVSAEGGAPAHLADDAGYFGGVATDGQFVFFSSPSRFMKVPVGGGATVEIPDATAPIAFTVDEQRVYWADGATVYSAKK